MRGTWSWLVAASLCVGGAGAAAAQDRAAQEPRRVRERVSVDATDQALGDVIRRIAADSGHDLVVEPALALERVSLTLRDVSWRIAVDVLAERVRCRVRELHGVLLLDRPTDLIDIELYDANVGTALLLLARYAGKSIVIGPQVQGTISLSLRGVSASRALSAVASAAGDFLVIPERDPAALRVAAGSRPSSAEPTSASAGPSSAGPSSAEERAAKPAAKPEPQERAFAGTLRRVSDGGLELELGSKQVVRVQLSANPAARERQRRLLAQLTVGTRVEVAVREDARGLVLTHLVAPRAGSSR
ncbi:MAG: hypothetical protein AB7N76_03355 [Planctomycetota bacterium]